MADGSETEIPAEKEVAQGTPPAEVGTTSTAVLESVVAQMAALTQSLEVTVGRVLRVVVEVCGAEMEAAVAEPRIVEHVRPCCGSPGIIAPQARRLIPPAAVGELDEQRTMWPAADLATAACPLEAYAAADLLPVDRVEPTELGADRHARACSGGPTPSRSCRLV
jgi:hypothetical protein